MKSGQMGNLLARTILKSRNVRAGWAGKVFLLKKSFGSAGFQGVMIFSVNLATNLRELSRIFCPFRDNSCNSLQFFE